MFLRIIIKENYTQMVKAAIQSHETNEDRNISLIVEDTNLKDAVKALKDAKTWVIEHSTNKGADMKRLMDYCKRIYESTSTGQGYDVNNLPNRKAAFYIRQELFEMTKFLDEVSDLLDHLASSNTTAIELNNFLIEKIKSAPSEVSPHLNDIYFRCVAEKKIWRRLNGHFCNDIQ